MKGLNNKLNSFKSVFLEKGFFPALRGIVVFLFRPFCKIIKGNVFLVNFFYGVWPNLGRKIFPIFVASGIVKFPKSELVEKTRYFWYSNIPGEFNLDGEKISRNDIFTYGGPNPNFTCRICQKFMRSPLSALLMETGKTL